MNYVLARCLRCGVYFYFLHGIYTLFIRNPQSILGMRDLEMMLSRLEWLNCVLSCYEAAGVYNNVPAAAKMISNLGCCSLGKSVFRDDRSSRGRRCQMFPGCSSLAFLADLELLGHDWVTLSATVRLTKPRNTYGDLTN